MKTAIHSLLALLAVGLSHVQADEASEFLQLDLWPDGIVFEIVESGEGGLLGLLPKVRGIIEKVRHMDPNIEFAVVSHGREEFALQTRFQSQFGEIHFSVAPTGPGQISLFEDLVYYLMVIE